MIEAWRVVKRRYSDHAFDGEGAHRYGGRWNSPGRRVVYVSETRALGTLEILAGLRAPVAVADYVTIPVRFEDGAVLDLRPADVPPGWDARPPSLDSQGVGDRWLDRAASPVLRVPSVVVPAESNFLLNPAHEDFATIEIGDPQELHLDPRLFNR